MFLQRNSTTSARPNITVSHLNGTGITNLGKVSHVRRTVSAQTLLKDFSSRNPRLAAMGWSPLHRGRFLGNLVGHCPSMLCDNIEKEKNESCCYRKPKPFFAA